MANRTMLLPNETKTVRYSVLAAMSFVIGLTVASVARSLNRWSVIFGVVFAAAAVGVEAYSDFLEENS